MARKRNAYMEYALFHRKRYEKMAGQTNLSPSTLVSMAKPDWDNARLDVKDFFKNVAKGLRNPSDYSSTIVRHETSSQRMETEAPITMHFSDGVERTRINSERILMNAGHFAELIENMKKEDFRKLKLGVVDFMTFVDYADGLSLPAEFGIVKAQLEEGLRGDDYTALLDIGHMYMDKRPGYANDAMISKDRVHGIDVFDKGRLCVDEFCDELTEEVNDDILLLCRQEDVRRITGSWAWLQKYGTLAVPLKILTFEEFIVSTMTYLEKLHHGTLEQINVPTKLQVTSLFSRATYNFEPTFRCDFHNNNSAACDKEGCALKNVKKYFCLLSEFLFKHLDFELVDGAHKIFKKGPSVPRGAQRGRSGRTAPPNSQQEPTNSGSSPEDVSPVERPLPPRRPAAEPSLSARNRKPHPEDGSSSITDSVYSGPSVPRKPKPETNAHTYCQDDKKSKIAAPEDLHAGAANPQQDVMQYPELPRKPQQYKKTGAARSNGVTELTYDFNKVSVDAETRKSPSPTAVSTSRRGRRKQPSSPRFSSSESCPSPQPPTDVTEHSLNNRKPPGGSASNRTSEPLGPPPGF